MSKLNVSVEEYTTPNPVTASEETSVEKLGELMREHGIRHILITQDDEVVGIVSERDLKVISGLNFNEKSLIKASDIMAADPVTVSSEASLDEVAYEMSKLKIGSVVVNEGNDLLGIFTVTDALNALIEIARENRKDN